MKSALVAGAAAATGIALGWLALVFVLRWWDIPHPGWLLRRGIRDGTVNLLPLLVAGVITLLVAVARDSADPAGAALVALIFAGVLLGNGLLFLRPLTRAWTPFDHLSLPYLPDRAPGPTGKVFDVFLSYRAEDEAVVRPVADWLIANGMRPWLDEYMILLTARGRTWDAIVAGMENCRYGVCFTTQAYSRATESTVRELEGLLEHRPREFVLQVRLDSEPHDFAPETARQLAECPHVMSFDGNRANLCTWLQEHLGAASWEPPVLPDLSGPRQLACSPKGDWVVDLSGWTRQASPPLPGDELAFVASRRLPGGLELMCNLIVGPAPPSWRTEDAERLSQPKPGTPGDEDFTPIHRRTMQDRMVDFAKQVHAEMGVPCAGVHLVYLNLDREKDTAQRIAHFGVTYWHDDHWSRRYSIVLSDGGGIFTEFAFLFEMDSSFREFCRYTSIMEHVVRSLRYGPLGRR